MANVNGLINANTPGLPVKNQTIPANGPAIIPLGPLDFTTNGGYKMDLTPLVQLGKIDFVQGFFVDNSSNPNYLSIQDQSTQQTIKFPPYSMGYLPIFCGNPPIVLVTTSVGSFSVNLWAYNIPIPPVIWDANPGAFTQLVQDVVLESIVSNGRALVVPYTFSDGDTVKELFLTRSNFTAALTGAGNTTVVTGAPRFFITYIDIIATPNAAISGGAATVIISVLSGTTTIFTGSVYIPAASFPTTAPMQPLSCLKLSNLNFIAPTDLDALILKFSSTLTTGNFVYNIGAGLTAQT